jgi:hypothetical protein
MIVAICALPLVVILPAVLLFGVGGYLSSKGYVQCPDQLGGQRFPVIRKVLPFAPNSILCDPAADRHSLVVRCRTVNLQSDLGYRHP